MKFRHWVENLFEAWSEIVVSHRWQVLIGTLLVTAAVAPQIRNGWIDVSIESFLPHDDPAIVYYNKFRRDFNYAPNVVIAIEMQDELFTLENLSRLKALHEDLESEVPYITDLTSLVNIRYSRGEGDSLLIDDLIEVWPRTGAEIPAFRELVMSNPNYVGGVISEDRKVTNIVMDPHLYTSEGQTNEFDDLMAGFEDETGTGADPEEVQPQYLSPEEEMELTLKTMEIMERHSSAEFTLYNAGGPTMNYQMGQDMRSSTNKSTTIGFGIIIVLLIVLFRRISGVLLPLIVVFLSLVMTLAIWPMMGFAYNGNTQIIPTFILAVGIADAVHILSIFYRHYDRGESRHDSIIIAMKQTSIAVLLTTVTTAASLLSFLTADMIPTQTMGIFGAIGVVMAFFYTLALLPSLLAIVPVKRRPNEVNDEEHHATGAMGILDTFIHGCGDFGYRHAKGVVASACIISLIAIAGIMQISFSHDPIRWYPKENHLRYAVDLTDSRMDGSMGVTIMLETEQDDILKEPAFLNTLEEIETLAENYRYKDTHTKEATSILSVVKETHQSLNRNDPEFFVIPQEKETVAQEMLLFENSGSDDIEDFTNTAFSVARIDLQMPWSNVLNYNQFIANLTDKTRAILDRNGYDHVQIEFVGLLALFGKTVLAMLWGTVESYALAFTLVASLMILLMENLRRGLLAFSPNLTPILITVGFMGWIGIPLNMFTSMLGCVVIGISVDDTIHFMHHFRRHAKTTDDIRRVIRKTLDTCGRAITFTSIVLIGGFIVHVTGMFTVNKQFGLLLSFAIFMALFANLILAPALMTLFWKHKEEENTTKTS
jgi:predicted RND superfamily exporter protein